MISFNIVIVNPTIGFLLIYESFSKIK